MGKQQQEHVIRSVGAPRQDDRFTFVLSAHYLEFSTGDSVDLRWAYDRLIDPKSGTCHQKTFRINPGSKTPIEIPGVDLENCDIILGHKKPMMSTSPEMAQMIEEQQSDNRIEIWCGEKMISHLAPDRISIGQFKGPLSASCTRTTALLHLTVVPS
jgi:hypothetical protein